MTTEFIKSMSGAGSKTQLTERQLALLSEVDSLILADVYREINKEVSALKLSKEKYFEREESMAAFLEETQYVVDHLKKVSKAEKYIALIALGHRLRMQEAVRVLPNNYFEGIMRVRNNAVMISQSLEIDLQS